VTLPLIPKCANIIETIARKAGDLALSHFFELSSLPVEAKGPPRLVTVADKEVEAFITRELIATFPNDGVFGEEGASRKVNLDEHGLLIRLMGHSILFAAAINGPCPSDFMKMDIPY
jgi:fructose-1,6-bisphosphatase/inositol monophosphatase family enzyme